MNPRALVASLLFLTACDSIASRQSHGPIVLGNPATIVTEADSQYLQDMVPDPAFDEPAAASSTPARDTNEAVAATPSRDTATNTQTLQPANTPAPSGLTADFGNVQIILPGVEARGANRSLKGATGAAFTLSATSFPGKTVVVRNGNAKRVQQRTGWSAVVNINGKPVLLSDLGAEYSGWQTLQGNGGVFTLATATAPSLKASPATIRNAVQKAARRQRLDRKAEQKLLSSVRGVTTAPLSVVPRAYLWKIDGTDAQGKAFSKEVRIDIPL